MRIPLLTLSLLLLPALSLTACHLAPTSPPAATAPIPISSDESLSASESWGNYSGDDPTIPTPADRAVREHLDQEIKPLDADSWPFKKVLTFFRDTTGTTIYVNWKTLEESGIDRKTFVNAHLSRITFRRALTTVLSEAAGGTANLAYQVVDGTITISTRDDLNSPKYQTVRVYDVRDMLAKLPPSPPPATAPAAATQPDMNDPADRARQDAMRTIMETIQSSVAPDSWRNAGGKIGSIRELNGQLIINQTIDNHRAIYKLLNELRETRAARIAIQSRILLLEADAYARLAKQFFAPAQQNEKLPSAVFDAAQYIKFAAALRAAKPVTLAEDAATIPNGGAIDSPFTSDHTFTSGYKPNMTLGHYSEYLRQLSAVRPGLTITSEMTISADRRFVVTKTSFINRKLVRIDSVPAPGIPPEEKLFIEKPILEEEHSSQMLAIPQGSTAIIAGPTVTATFPKQWPATDLANPTKRLLLILTPKIIITPPAAVPKTPPYTDEQAQAFAAKLPDVRYPTDIAAACRFLGIALSRLSPDGHIESDINGIPGAMAAQLSPHYWITFQFQDYLSYTGITNVFIAKPNTKLSQHPVVHPNPND